MSPMGHRSNLLIIYQKQDTSNDFYDIDIKATIFKLATTLTQASITIQDLLSFHLEDNKPGQ